nr:crustin 164 [Rimicaris sp.]
MARLTVLVLLLVVAVLGAEGGHQQRDCLYWCKRPNKSVYCCGTDPYTDYGNPSSIHGGFCPQYAAECPHTRGFAAPQVCPFDGFCQRTSKCCYDTCLDHHTCKPSRPFSPQPVIDPILPPITIPTIKPYPFDVRHHDGQGIRSGAGPGTRPGDRRGVRPGSRRE